MALHHRSVEPQTTQAYYGRGHPVNDSEVTDRDRQPVTALAVVVTRHLYFAEPLTVHSLASAVTLSTAPTRDPRDHQVRLAR